MQLPSFLPEQYANYQEATDDQALFDALVLKPVDLIFFFEYACDDLTWAEMHPQFFRLALQWFTTEILHRRLSRQSGKRLTTIIKSHFSLLSAEIPFDIIVQTKDKEIPVNSLLMSESSSIFRTLIFVECEQKKSNKLTINRIPENLLPAVVEYIHTGTVPYLWRHSKDEIMVLRQLSAEFELDELAVLCEETLKRYVNKINALEMLVKCYENSWKVLGNWCCQLISENRGVIITLLEEDQLHQKRLAFEFLNAQEPALELFSQLKGLITHLICAGNISEESIFSEIVQGCPKLISLDLSRSQRFSERMLDAPTGVEKLDLSQCSWLTHAILARFVSVYPNVSHLNLASNTQLSFLAWSELTKMKQLKSLGLSNCNQITDEDFSLILKGSPSLIELSMEDCRKLSEKAFFELSRMLPQVVLLNVARCSITDAALQELAARCNYLYSLDISRCKDLSERGIVKSIPQFRALRVLHAQHCGLSDEALEQIKQLQPSLSML